MGKEKEAVEGVVLLRSRVRRREDPGAAPEGEALQVPRMPQEALHRQRHGHPRPSVTKVPNAKPDRESTEIEIFGMQGIPPELLAAHYGEGTIVKIFETELADIAIVDSTSLTSCFLQVLPFGLSAVWTHIPLGDCFGTMELLWEFHLQVGLLLVGHSLGFRLSQYQFLPHLLVFHANNHCFLFRITFSLTSTSAPGISPHVPVSQPLFPINNASTLLGTTMSSFPTILKGLPDSVTITGTGGGASYANSHMYASGPNTGVAIGPPPVISSKPASQPTANEVYLVWDDEAMCMEERRSSLGKY